MEIPLLPFLGERVTLIEPTFTIVLLLDSCTGELIKGFLNSFRILRALDIQLLGIGFRNTDTLQTTESVNEAEGGTVFCFRGWQGIDGVPMNALRTLSRNFLFPGCRGGQ